MPSRSEHWICIELAFGVADTGARELRFGEVKAGNFVRHPSEVSALEEARARARLNPGKLFAAVELDAIVEEPAP